MKPSTPGFVGAALREARKARGLTGALLAEKIDVTKQAISSYETGKSPSPDVAERICEVLHFPLSYFLNRPRTKLQRETPYFYRSMSATTRLARDEAEIKMEWLVHLSSIVETFIELPQVNFPVIDLPSDPTKISDELIEDIASQLRTFWGLGNGPISNSAWLLENNGAIVVRRRLNAETLDAFSIWVRGRPFIVLSSDKNCAARSRFDIAHELGHLILHRNVPELYIKTPEYFKLIEQQAHRFAGAIQFPISSFAKEVSSANLEVFRILKHRWNLSIAMMIKRAEDLDFLNERKRQALWRSYASSGWREQEPLDDKLIVEKPRVIREAIELLLSEEILSRSDILSEMNLYHGDVEDSCGLPSNFLNPKAGDILHLRRHLRQQEFSEVHDRPGKVIEFRPEEKLRN